MLIGDNIPKQFIDYILNSKKYTDKMKILIEKDLIEVISNDDALYLNKQGEYEYNAQAMYDVCYYVDNVIENAWKTFSPSHRKKFFR
jgi:hypothetical protein